MTLYHTGNQISAISEESHSLLYSFRVFLVIEFHVWPKLHECSFKNKIADNSLATLKFENTIIRTDIVWFHGLCYLKVAFIQKGLMRLSFLQTDEPNYFPELEFWFFFHSKWLKSCQIRTWSCSNAFFELSEQLHVLIWHDLSHLEWKKNQKCSSGK